MPTKKSSVRSASRRLLLTCAAVAALLVPMRAFALESLISIAQSTLEKIAQDIEEAAALSAATIESTVQQLLSKQSGTESLLAAGEKITAGKKELTQAKLNYQAARDANDRYITAQNTFLDASAQPIRVCEGLAERRAALSMFDAAQLIEKAATRTTAKSEMYVDNSAAYTKEVLANYRNKYCSTADVQRGRCDSAVAPDMQAAAISAHTLLIPTANETYTAREANAARDFIQMATNPMPIEMLPRGLEETPAGRRFQVAHMSAQARMSVATGALNHVLSTRVSQGAGSAQSLSVVGLMKEEVERKHGDASYAAALSGKQERALYGEINSHLVTQNWMDFHAFNQGLRIESILATQLSVAASTRAAKEVGSARVALARR